LAILHSYQAEIINGSDRLHILQKSRQIGGSFALAFKAINNAIFKKRNQILVSASQRQANLLMSYVDKFIESFRYLEEFKGLKLDIDQQAHKRFSKAIGGASIYSLPPKPETIRAFNGDVILDEFALYKNDELIYEAVLPMILRGWDLFVSSTCFGMQNIFYQISSDEVKYPDFKRKSITIYDAIKQGLNVDVDLIKRNYDTDSFRQEFLCEFVDESTSYFPYVLLRELIDDFDESQIKGKCYIGIDIGRSHDRTAIIVLKEFNETFYLTQKEVLEKTMFETQREIIEQIFYENNPEKVFIDKGLIGMQLAEMLEDKYTFVEGVQFNNLFISEIVTNAKKLFEQKKFKMNDDKDLISEIHSINKKVSSNVISFSSKRTDKGHSDSAWALLLALNCSKYILNDFKMAFID